MAFGLVPIVLLVYGVGVACLLWLRRGRTAFGIEPRCAACAYIVHGLPAPTCPECGANLAQPGAVVTTGRHPPGRLARSVGWLILCLLAVVIPIGLIWQGLVMPALPSVRDISNEVTLYQPDSKAYGSIAVIAHTREWVYPNSPDPLPGNLKLRIKLSDGTIRELAIDSATLRFREVSPSASPMSSTPLDADALVAWLKGIAVQGETDELHREMASVMTQVRQAVSRPAIHQTSTNRRIGMGFSGAGSSSGGTINRPWWVGSVPLLIGAVVWVIGMIRIMLKRPTPAGDSHMIA